MIQTTLLLIDLYLSQAHLTLSHEIVNQLLGEIFASNDSDAFRSEIANQFIHSHSITDTHVSSIHGYFSKMQDRDNIVEMFMLLLVEYGKDN